MKFSAILCLFGGLLIFFGMLITATPGEEAEGIITFLIGCFIIGIAILFGYVLGVI